MINMNQMGASQGPTDRKFERLLLMFILVPHQVDPVLPGLEEELEEEEWSDQRGRGCRRTDRELKIVLSSGYNILSGRWMMKILQMSGNASKNFLFT